jgi:hypothetical protein
MRVRIVLTPGALWKLGSEYASLSPIQIVVSGSEYVWIVPLAPTYEAWRSTHNVRRYPIRVSKDRFSFHDSRYLGHEPICEHEPVTT